MSYKCVIVDDEALARELIETHLSQLADFELIGSCASAIEASKLLQQHKIDLLFLDIEMPVLKGTDFFKNLFQKPKVIFTTAYRDYALEGFELDAVDYLLKPIVFHRFFKAIEKFLATQKENQPPQFQGHKTPLKENQPYIFIRENRKQVKISLDDILYIESLKDYIKIHFKDKIHLTKTTLSSFERELDARFVRVHRSFIVNQQKVTAFTKQDVEIGDIEIPIGENYKENLRFL